MKIKIAILERDVSYLTRIVSAFGAKYADKLELYSFTDPEVAMATLNSARIDVLLASDAFQIDCAKLPNRCAFAYLVDSLGIETFNDQRAICKFQKADLIYKQILSVYSEKASSITGFKMTGDECMVIAFCAPSGGVGGSTMAAACAVNYAKKGRKVLYLNLEKLGSANVFFSGQGQFGMTDIITALKSRKTNLPMKLESCVMQDESGVYFYSQADIALDMMELTTEETIRLISELKLTGGYEYIILDMDFDLSGETLKLYRQIRSIIWVGDGSLRSNNKTERAHAALAILERNADAPLVDRLSFIYNKVSSKFGQQVNLPGVRILGGAPRYTGATASQIVEQLAAMEVFEDIIDA